MVVVARCGRTASTASAMIETLGMMIVVQGTNWLTMCRIGTVGFEGWSGCHCVESARGRACSPHNRDRQEPRPGYGGPNPRATARHCLALSAHDREGCGKGRAWRRDGGWP